MKLYIFARKKLIINEFGICRALAVIFDLILPNSFCEMTVIFRTVIVSLVNFVAYSIRHLSYKHEDIGMMTYNGWELISPLAHAFLVIPRLVSSDGSLVFVRFAFVFIL